MIFDVYYSSTEYTNQPYTYPWYSKKGLSRSEIIHTFKNKVSYKLDESSPESCCRIDFKVYLDGPKKLTKKKGSDKYSNMICKSKGYIRNNTCIFATLMKGHTEFNKYQRGSSNYSRKCISEDIANLRLELQNR